MADNPKVRGKREGNKVSKQRHELEYLKRKFDISGQAAAAAQRERGPDPAKWRLTSRSRSRGRSATTSATVTC